MKPFSPEFWREEKRVFFTALMFYSRIPCPSWVDHSPDYLDKATRYFPLVGWIVGAVAAAVFSLGAVLWNPVIGALLCTGATLLLTGAFHEDGWADMCDGFGGGYTPAKILDIMKDSRLGTYGAVGLGVLLSLKIAALAGIGQGYWMSDDFQVLSRIAPFYVENWQHGAAALFCAHPLSRALAVQMIGVLDYAREDETSKVKPVAKSFPLSSRLVALFFGLLPLAIVSYWQPFSWAPFVGLIAATGGVAYIGRMAKRRLGGYTGDCLGAAQQLAEVAFYLALAMHF